MDPLLDEGQADLEAELLSVGRDVGMSPELRQKTLAALGITAATVSGVALTKTGLLASFSGKGTLVWGASVLGAVGVAGGALAWSLGWVGAEDTPLPAVATEVAGRDLGSPAPADSPLADRDLGRAQPATSLDGGDGPPDDPVADPEGALDATDRSGSLSGPNVTRERQSQLRAELSSIGRAEVALRAGQATRALAELEDYRRRFPQRQLGLEAEVLTIQALYESGSKEVARKRAARFLQRYPSSPLGVRAEQYLK